MEAEKAAEAAPVNDNPVSTPVDITGGAPVDITGGAPVDITGGAPVDITGGAPVTLNTEPGSDVPTTEQFLDAVGPFDPLSTGGEFGDLLLDFVTDEGEPEPEVEPEVKPPVEPTLVELNAAQRRIRR